MNSNISLAEQWFRSFYQTIANTDLSPWLQVLPAQLADWQKNQHGDFAKWQRLLAKFPATEPSVVELAEAVRFGSATDISDYQQKQIEGLLRQFMPWRKGPFFVHDIHVDTEWRSDWKWDRVSPHIDSLAGKKVLDVGCGSGYHMWRMLAQQPELVVGVDPTALFLIQFQAIKQFNPDPRIHFLPVGGEDVPALKAFDTTFCMGVLYHRRSPVDFLHQLRSHLKPGGQLVLETLVVEGDATTVLMPGERYAQMRNVWFIPSTAALTVWLERCGFKNIRVADIDQTSTDEQRSTDWMTGQSLADFLDPTNPNLTVEGYPAPLRATLIAEA